MIFSILGELGEISATLAMSPNLHILHSNNKPRRSQYVHTSNFTFSCSNTALGTSFEVRRPASRGECFWKTMQRQVGRGTSKLAPNAVLERENVKLEVCTYWERRGLLFGCKVSSYDSVLKHP